MSDRIPLSKKTRFEVFKRDGFACQYCGAHPPKVVLEVDHIVAVAAGGGNEDTNLITACFNCNRGKAARDLAVVPKSLAERAAGISEREEQVLGYNRVMAEQRERIEAEVWEVFRHWRDQRETTNDRFKSVKTFIGRLGLHEVLDAVDIAMSSHLADFSEWKYFCGVCWGKIRDAER